MKTMLASFLVVVVWAAVSTASGQAAATSQRGRTTPIKIGETAPDFTLADATGKSVTLSKLRKPVVLVFYRGYW